MTFHGVRIEVLQLAANMKRCEYFLGQTAEPAMALVAIHIAAEDIQSEMADEIQLGAAMRDLRRQQAVIALVGEPLPVVRRVNNAVGMPALQHPPDLGRGFRGIMRIRRFHGADRLRRSTVRMAGVSTWMSAKASRYALPATMKSIQ